MMKYYLADKQPKFETFVDVVNYIFDSIQNEWNHHLSRKELLRILNDPNEEREFFKQISPIVAEDAKLEFNTRIKNLRNFILREVEKDKIKDFEFYELEVDDVDNNDEGLLKISNSIPGFIRWVE